MEMAKLSDAMVRSLRIAAGGEQPPKGPTRAALLRRHLVRWTGPSHVQVEITPSGRDALAEIDRAERETARQAEIAARPVPDMIGEPSARTAPPMPVDHEDEGESIPEVPQAWIDHLVTLLDAGVRIEHTGHGWHAVERDRVRYGIDPERLDAAAAEAVRRGIAARAGGRLALADSFRMKRAEARGIVESAVVVYRPPLGGVRVGNQRWAVLRVTEGSAKVRSTSTGWVTWWVVERVELADRHEFQPFPGGACTGTVWDAEGDAQNCPWPADHPIHLPPTQHVYRSHPYRSECRTAVQRNGQYEPCGKPAKDSIHR